MNGKSGEISIYNRLFINTSNNIGKEVVPFGVARTQVPGSPEGTLTSYLVQQSKLLTFVI